MIGALLQTALKIGASRGPALTQKALQIQKNKKFIEGLKFKADTKWASRNLLHEKPYPRFTPDLKNPNKLIRK